MRIQQTFLSYINFSTADTSHTKTPGHQFLQILLNSPQGQSTPWGCGGQESLACLKTAMNISFLKRKFEPLFLAQYMMFTQYPKHDICQFISPANRPECLAAPVHGGSVTLSASVIATSFTSLCPCTLDILLPSSW